MSETSIAMADHSSRSRIARVLARPRAIVIGLVVLLSGLGWIYCGLMVAGALTRGEAGALGPGMAFVTAWLPQQSIAPWLQAICAPFTTGGRGDPLSAAVIFGMWAAMTLAMMLPTAAPMLVTYAELCETAARKREPAVSPVVLAAGYIAVWLAFALAAAALSLLLRPAAAGAMAPAGGVLTATTFAVAGLYQFSALKQACLRLCRRPFTILFANWSDRPGAIFRLGLRQGLYCLGCCWAAMLVMFAVGLMNVVWMAGLGIAMTLEKMFGERFRRGLGAAFLVLAAVQAVAWAWPFLTA